MLLPMGHHAEMRAGTGHIKARTNAVPFKASGASTASVAAFKMAAGAAYAILLGILATPLAISSTSGGAQTRGSATVIELDKFGPRGWVQFNHDNHAARQNPDPNAVFKTRKGASCSGCHHTQDLATGAPQLWRCSGCHRNSGDPKNPKGRDGDEQWSETAYHNLCIGCHIASTKGPTKCGDCHHLRDGR
jgi:hypothetical protein